MNSSFKFHRKTALAAATSLVFCSAALTMPTVDANGPDGAAPVRPMGGVCHTEFAFNATGAVDLVGTCNLQHLGLTSLVATEIVIPEGDHLRITTVDTYTAANGDELYSSFVGTGVFASPTEAQFSGTETFTGGTGRFTNAAGSVANSGSAQFTSATAGVGRFKFEGTISY